MHVSAWKYFDLCIIVHKLTMKEKYLKNLAEQILKKIETENYTIVRFADECGVSLREINNIKNRKVKNISFDTLVKICDTHNISYADIFDYHIKIDENLRNLVISELVLTDGKTTYFLSRMQSNNK